MSVYPHITMKMVLLLQLLPFSLNPCAQAVSNQQAEPVLKHAVNTLYKARNSAVDRQRKQERINHLSQIEQKDFTLFISYLDGRILYYCDELYHKSGTEGLSDTPCPKLLSDNDAIEYNIMPELPDTTEEEKVRTLNEDFAASLNQFDDMLLNEQVKISQTIPKQREYRGSESGNSADDQDHSGTSRRTTETSPGSRKQPDGITTGTGNTRIPDTKGSKDLSTNDDDIIAKQLREAAEQETDPEIKEKLWEEYQKYKQSQNGGAS